MPNYEPSRRYSNSPKSEVHVDATVLLENSECLQAIAKGLPSTLSATQKPRVSNDHGLVVPGKVLHNEVTEVMRLLAVLLYPSVWATGLSDPLVWEVGME